MACAGLALLASGLITGFMWIALGWAIYWVFLFEDNVAFLIVRYVAITCVALFFLFVMFQIYEKLIQVVMQRRHLCEQCGSRQVLEKEETEM